MRVTLPVLPQQILLMHARLPSDTFILLGNTTIYFSQHAFPWGIAFIMMAPLSASVLGKIIKGAAVPVAVLDDMLQAVHARAKSGVQLEHVDELLVAELGCVGGRLCCGQRRLTALHRPGRPPLVRLLSQGHCLYWQRHTGQNTPDKRCIDAQTHWSHHMLKGAGENQQLGCLCSSVQQRELWRFLLCLGKEDCVRKASQHHSTYCLSHCRKHPHHPGTSLPHHQPKYH